MALTDALVYCTCCFTDAGRAASCAAPRVDPDGQPACERCGRRLSKVKHHRPHSPGRACAPRCKGAKRLSEERAASAERPTKIHRRTKSEPGQPQQQRLPVATTRLRIRAPKPPPSATKPRLVKPTVDPVDLMTLLDVAHARRMALLEAEKNGTGSSAMNASSVVWQ